jgi:hypothetical protein
VVLFGFDNVFFFSVIVLDFLDVETHDNAWEREIQMKILIVLWWCGDLSVLWWWVLMCWLWWLSCVDVVLTVLCWLWLVGCVDWVAELLINIVGTETQRKTQYVKGIDNRNSIIDLQEDSHQGSVCVRRGGEVVF